MSPLLCGSDCNLLFWHVVNLCILMDALLLLFLSSTMSSSFLFVDVIVKVVVVDIR